MERTSVVSMRHLAQVMLLTALCGCALLPLYADANGKPETTGQARAAEVSKKTTNADTTSSEAEEDSEESDEESDDEKDKSKNKSTKPKGLERAAAAGNKPEEIRAQLTYIMMLIDQMRNAMDGRGIGRELSKFIANGRQLPDPEPEPEEPNEPESFAVMVLGASTVLVDNDDTTADDDTGLFEIEIEVTASGTDLVIPDAVGTEATTSNGVVFSIENVSGTVVTTGTTSATVVTSEDQDAETGDFVINDGTSAVLTVEVEFDPEESGEYRVLLKNMTVNGEVFDLIPVEEYQTDLLAI